MKLIKRNIDFIDLFKNNDVYRFLILIKKILEIDIILI